MRTTPSNRSDSASKLARAARRIPVSSMRTRDWLDLTRLADMPFVVSWFLLADSKLRKLSLGTGWDAAVSKATASRSSSRWAAGADSGSRSRLGGSSA